jgi:hypothetical protein
MDILKVHIYIMKHFHNPSYILVSNLFLINKNLSVMKTKTLLLISLLLSFSMTQLSSQTLQKGNIIGIHVRTITLQPNVTMDKYLDFYMNKYIPEYEKNFPGVELYVIKGIRGESENSFGLLYLIKSIEVRDKYWPQADLNTELASEALKKIQPTADELRKLGAATRISQTDWIIL